MFVFCILEKVELGNRNKASELALHQSLHSGSGHIPLEFKVMAVPYTRAPRAVYGGVNGTRTCDLYNVNVAL